MNTVFPRLPMLHSIGRSSGIDMEEPPEDCQVEDDNNKSQFLRTCNDESINVLMGKFDHAFVELDPGGYICNKFSSKLKNTSLMHCWKGAELVKHICKLKQMMILKSKLEFQKDVMLCLESSTKLEELIKKSVQSELDMWDDICHNRIHSPIRTNLIELCDMCDDLRVQMNFWSSLWKRLFCNPQLRMLYAEVSEDMMKVKIHFDRINLRCISWLSRLVFIGFRVLAHCDLDRIEYESLCNIVKGIEEFNLLVSNCKFSIKRFNYDILFDISSLKLSNLLKLLAYERSKYSAVSCKEYLFGSLDFLKEVQNYNFKDHIWLDGLNLSYLQKDSNRRDSDICKMEEVFPIPGMLLRISEALSSSYPPLMDFIRREKGFIESLLHAVCHVTTLLFLEKMIDTKEQDQSALGSQSQCVKPTNRVMAFVSNILDPHKTSDCIGHGKPHKKNVSWNDSMMTSLANFIASQYFVEVWQCFVDNFVAFMEGFYWTGSPISSDHLGCLVLSNDVVSYLISHVLDITAHKGWGQFTKDFHNVEMRPLFKGLFPTVVHPHFLELSLRYLLFPSQNIWKMKLSQNISSPSSKSDLESQMDMFQNISKSLIPFKITFENFHGYLDNFGQTSVHKAPLRVSESFLRSYRSTMACFIFTCSELIGLCRKNILKSLAQSDLQSFLSCSRSHVKVLTTHLEEACRVSSKVLNSVEVASKESDLSINWMSCILVQHLKCVSDEVNSVLDLLKDLSNMASMSFKELCSHNAIQFFKNDMPTGKMWKRKDDQNQQQKPHNEYIEKGIEMLLKPVMSASMNLDTRERVQVLSTVIHELFTAWMNNILEKKIKFSYYGACQLERDVLFVRSTLQTSKLSSKLLSLDVFDYLRNVISLLKQQPYKGKSNSYKSDSKSNSIESSPLTTKLVDSQSTQSTATVGASNGALLLKRPSKKNRSSSRSLASREEKSEKSSKPNQEGRPKFGRSAKVSTNSTDMPEVQNNHAFTKDEEKFPTDLNDLKDTKGEATVPKDKLSINPSGTSGGPTGNGIHVTSTELNASHNGPDPSSVQKTIKSNEKKSVEENNITQDSDNGDESKLFANDVKHEDFEFSDVEGNDQSPPRVSSNQQIARKEEWLALRVRRGNRTWPRLPLCFSGSIDSCGS